VSLLILLLLGCPKTPPAPAIEAPPAPVEAPPAPVEAPRGPVVDLQLKPMPAGLDGPVEALASGPGSSVLVSTRGPVVRLVEVPGGALVAAMPIEDVQQLAVSPDGRTAALGAWQHMYGVGLADGRTVWHATYDENPRRIVYLPDSSALLLGVSNRAELRSATDGAVRWSYTLGPPPTDDDVDSVVALASHGQEVFVGEHDHVTRLDLATGAVRGVLGRMGPHVGLLGVTPDGRHLLAGGWDKRVTCWEITTGASCGAVDMAGWVSAMEVSPDGRLVAATDLSGGVVVLAVPGLALVAQATLDEETDGSLTWTRDGRWLVVGADTLQYAPAPVVRVEEPGSLR
jgi:hypothetical protein